MCHPTSRGRMTLWPRLEIGKSSETPCSSPSIAPWKYEIGNALRGGARRPLAARVEPREDEAGEPDEERRDAVLRVVVARPGLVSREERREGLRGLGPVDDRDRDQGDADDDGQRGEELAVGHAGSLGPGRVRRVGELAKLRREEVCGLFADVDGAVADALDRACD